jgi:hypothetical protein
LEAVLVLALLATVAAPAEMPEALAGPAERLVELGALVDRTIAVAAAALVATATTAMVRAQATTMASAMDQSPVTTPIQM